MSEFNFSMLPGESEDQYLLRLGAMKESHEIDLTWTELALVLNTSLQCEPKTESYWRKRYHTLSTEPFTYQEGEEVPDMLKEYFTSVEKQRIRAKDERRSYDRSMRAQARADEIIGLFEECIHRYDQKKPQTIKRVVLDRPKAMYVMLSDIHYGMSFHSLVGSYDTDIARTRLQRYAQKIKEYGVGCSACYVSLMGDLISGIIHPGIRVENKENLIEQVVGVSELVADFLYDLASYFDTVHVNAVSGNHSRIDANLENVLRKERLDDLVPWYCRTKLEKCKNVFFYQNDLDVTIGSFEIFGKTYVSVHGDMEKDLKTSSLNISRLAGRHIDYFLSGHTHVPVFRMEDTRYITNGCVCGSGDDYTIKKRLFGQPVQVCMICSEQGVEAIHPVELDGVSDD